MERMATDNPALDSLASQLIHPGRAQSRQSRLSRQSRRTTPTFVEVSDPSGDQEIISREPSRQLAKYDVGWRRIVRNFSPSWFSVTMGTGIVSLLLITIPFQAHWLYWLSVIFFGLNTILFTIAFTISFLRYTLYPEIWTVMIQDSIGSLFLGTMPIGFATLIESWIFLCCPYWGPWSVTFAWICWMIDAIVASAITVALPTLSMSQSSQHTLDRITAAQLLPISATIVAAGTGAEIAEILPNSDHALGTLITSYVMWGMAAPLSLTILVMYYQRLALHKLPPREVIVSVFLPLGPLGMGGYTILTLGEAARKIFPWVKFFDDLEIAGDIAYILGIFISQVMWGFGLIWLAFALATIYQCRPFPFNMGWWGFTFPIGVYAISTIKFGEVMPSEFFKVLGTIFSVVVVLLWMIVAARTVRGAWSGRLFHAPCLANLPQEKARPKGLTMISEA